jgi:hypothetical protein
MLQFADTPYESYPPKPNPLFIRLVHQHNRFLNLPGKRHRITSFSLHNAERLDAIKHDRNARVLFLANHSTHSDPQIMSEVQRRLGMHSCYMAAYDVFQRDKLNAWIMQRFGAFSVDRDGSDRASMKFAMDILKEGRYALTIFPEGNVYFMNDRACPFLDGASFIALKVQKDLGPDIRVYVVPVSNKATHRTDQRGAVVDKVSALAFEMGTGLDRSVDLRSELMRIGEMALSLQFEGLGYLPPGSENMEFGQFLEASAQPIIERLEKNMELKARVGESTEDRIRRIRSQIHQIRIDPDKDAEYPQATRWAEEAILAMRILSYTGHYIEEKPTLDRYAETVEKMTEDLSGDLQRPWAPRHVHSCINQPIDLASYLEAYQSESRATMAQLTDACEKAVQAGLDEMNALNRFSGSELF